MNVVVESLLSGSASGSSVVSTSADATVASVIFAFCLERGIQPNSSYILKDGTDATLNSNHTIRLCEVKDGDVLYLTIRDGHETTLGFNNWWIMAAISFLIGGVGLVAISIIYTTPGSVPFVYGIVVDAGSSHTTMYVYKWKGNKYNGTGEPSQVGECQVGASGISSYANNLAELGRLMQVCLNEVTLNVIPAGSVPSSVLFLGATAGMRLLNMSNPTAAQTIMNIIELTFNNSGLSFIPNQSSIITGEEEAEYGWITVNYLNHSLNIENSDVLASTNTLDLGGASLEIAFELSPITTQTANTTNVTLYGKDHLLYAESYLCYGLFAAAGRHHAELIYKDVQVPYPCHPQGYNSSFTVEQLFASPCTYMTEHKPHFPSNTIVTYFGTGNLQECSSTVFQLLNYTRCYFDYKYPDCFSPPQYRYTEQSTVAMSEFAAVIESLNWTEAGGSLPQLQKSVDAVCNRTIDQVDNKSVSLCFNGQYIYHLLVEGFKFNETTFKNIKFVSEIADTEVEWALGFMIKQTNGLPTKTAPDRLSLTVLVILMAMFIIFILVSAGFSLHARRIQSTSMKYQRLSHYGAI